MVFWKVQTPTPPGRRLVRPGLALAREHEVRCRRYAEWVANSLVAFQTTMPVKPGLPGPTTTTNNNRDGQGQKEIADDDGRSMGQVHLGSILGIQCAVGVVAASHGGMALDETCGAIALAYSYEYIFQSTCSRRGIRDTLLRGSFDFACHSALESSGNTGPCR